MSSFKRKSSGAQQSSSKKPKVELTGGLKIVQTSDYEDSAEQTRALFAWLISPTTIDEYDSKYWEKQILHIKRHETQPDYFQGWLHKTDIERILLTEDMRYGRDIDVTNYIGGKRITLNPKPQNGELYRKADSKWVWRQYNAGASLRLLCPQAYSPQLHQLLYVLEEVWGSGTSSNVYLTPKGSQGFAPHYDDVEVFILQVEGEKRWRLYPPRNPQEPLARFSSPNFDQADIGEPFFDEVLKTGDLLCLPRGTIHQAVSSENSHSLHITVSCGYLNTYADYISRTLTAAIEKASHETIDLRKSIPRNFMNLEGQEQIDFQNKIKELTDVVIASITPSQAIDLNSKNYLHSRLPIKSFVDPHPVEITAKSKVRLTRRNIARLIPENDTHCLYFSVDNSIHFQENPPKYLEVEELFVSAIKCILESYPNYILVEELPSGEKEELEEEDKIDLVTSLREAGIVTLQ